MEAEGIKFSDEWYVNDISQIVRATRQIIGIRIVGIIGNNNIQNKVIDLKSKVIY